MLLEGLSEAGQIENDTICQQRGSGYSSRPALDIRYITLDQARISI
jgi:hypothetical protein